LIKPPEGKKYINMKTVKQWLENAEYFWRKQALENMVFPDTKVSSLSEAIDQAFFSFATPEGIEFWLTITSYVKLEEAYNKELETTIIKAKIQLLLDKGVTYVWYPTLSETFEFLLDNPVYHATSLKEVQEYAANEGKFYADEYTFYNLKEELNNY